MKNSTTEAPKPRNPETPKDRPHRICTCLAERGHSCPQQLANWKTASIRRPVGIYHVAADKNVRAPLNTYPCRRVAMTWILPARMPALPGLYGGALVWIGPDSSGNRSFNVRKGWKGIKTILGMKYTGSVFGSLNEPASLYSKSFVTGQKTVLTSGP